MRRENGKTVIESVARGSYPDVSCLYVFARRKKSGKNVETDMHDDRSATHEKNPIMKDLFARHGDTIDDHTILDVIKKNSDQKIK